jgi:hypothetical protein
MLAEGSKFGKLRGCSIYSDKSCIFADESLRKHRERKETYIKSLEQQVLQLLNQQATAADEKRAVNTENTMLKELLAQHGIPIPSDVGGLGPTAQISILDVPGGQQRLQVTMPEIGPDYFAGFGTPRFSIPRDTSSPESLDAEMEALSSDVPSISPPAIQTRLPGEGVQTHSSATPQAMLTEKILPPSPAYVPHQPISHPHGLDAPQVGIDFVLALENPCLHHTRDNLESTESYGHILTTNAPLLTQRPRIAEPTSSWTIPAAEIERLLNLSSQLNLAGELTPVQAWSRIRCYPGFEKLNRVRLETLERALLEEIQCYGYVHALITRHCWLLTCACRFGAVMDEGAFEKILQQCFWGIQ